MLRASELTYRPYQPRSFAYISDTAAFGALPGMVRGVDLLYHEATFGDDCAEKAAESGAGKLVIGHFSSRYKDPSVLLAQAREVFPETEMGWEGREFEVPVKKTE